MLVVAFVMHSSEIAVAAAQLVTRMVWRRLVKRVKKRDEEGWSQEWSGEDDEDACAGYQPDLGRHVSLGTLMLH